MRFAGLYREERVGKYAEENLGNCLRGLCPFLLGQFL